MNTRTDPNALARYAIGVLLDGKSPNGTTPSELGWFAEVYGEMLRAYQTGGTESARQVYVAYAERDAAIAALRAADPEPARQVWTVADLLMAEFPPPKWAVPELLPVGLVVLAGRPKLGKSWLSLQTAVAVGTGGQVLGRQVDKGRVLYLALEDNPRRLQDRLRKQQAPRNAGVDFRFEWQSLTEGGTADLMTAISQEGYRLVVIDTISRALGRADQLDQADMNVAFGALQRLALEKEIALLLVDHHRKSAGGAGDVIDDVMGATSKVGVADCAMGLYRGRGESTATLKVSGRDVDDQELALQWDPQLFCWQLVGTAAGVKAQSVQADIIAALEEMGGEAGAAELARWLGKRPNNITRELSELVAKGVLMRCEPRGTVVPYRLMG
jgi:hypothetical protein